MSLRNAILQSFMGPTDDQLICLICGARQQAWIAEQEHRATSDDERMVIGVRCETCASERCVPLAGADIRIGTAEIVVSSAAMFADDRSTLGRQLFELSRQACVRASVAWAKPWAEEVLVELDELEERGLTKAMRIMQHAHRHVRWADLGIEPPSWDGYGGVERTRDPRPLARGR